MVQLWSSSTWPWDSPYPFWALSVSQLRWQHGMNEVQLLRARVLTSRSFPCNQNSPCYTPTSVGLICLFPVVQNFLLVNVNQKIHPEHYNVWNTVLGPLWSRYHLLLPFQSSDREQKTQESMSPKPRSGLQRDDGQRRLSCSQLCSEVSQSFLTDLTWAPVPARNPPQLSAPPWKSRYSSF